MVSHDLRTPLTSIGLTLSLLNEDWRTGMPESVKHLLENTEANIMRLRILVDQVLDLQKFEADKLDLDIDCITLSEAIAGASDSIVKLAAMKGIQLCGPSGDAAIMGDRLKLEKAIRYLILHAINISPSCAALSININHQGKWAEIQISERTGVVSIERSSGSPETDGQRSEPAQSGVGLGLLIAKDIVEAHGGTVELQTDSSVGDIFRVQLLEVAE
jgi:K+-sensing histidine kinase KdpD